MHLSEETPLVVTAPNKGAGPSPDWQTIKLGVIPRMGLILASQNTVVFPQIRPKTADACFITLGPAKGLAGELTFEIRWRFAAPRPAGASSSEVVLFRGKFGNVDSNEPWNSYQCPLDRVAGTDGSIVLASRSTWRFWLQRSALAVYELVICDPASLDLERARSFRALRIRNEQANFDAYYQHAFFQVKDTDAKDVEAATLSESDAGARQPSAISSSAPATAPKPVAPTALEYSRARLAEKIKLDPPAFGWLLRRRVEALPPADSGGNRAKIRVLSICSGAARIEADIVRPIPQSSVSLTLLDVNDNLLKLARTNLAAWGPVETITADVNELDLRGRVFDVVLCVSALHHVVELEHVIEEVARAIGDKGEFWSIGETLGRNGGRMWPEPYNVANDFFCALEKKYRYNRMTGVVDTELLNIDHSIGCFEGIRAESIEPTLLQFLRPVHVAKHNCILHRLFSLSYSDNYDMAEEKDRALVDAAVDLDVALHAQGRFDIELNGVYGGIR